MSNDNALMGEPLSEAEDAAARIRAYLDACSGANSFGREIRWELRDAKGHPYNLPRADLVAVLDGLAAEAKDCEILEEGYINAMDDYGNQMTEVEQLRARVGVLEGQLSMAREDLNEQRWYGEQLQMSIEGCSGNHHEIEEYPGDSAALGLDGGGSDE